MIVGIGIVGDNLKVDEFIGNDPNSFFGSTNTETLVDNTLTYNKEGQFKLKVKFNVRFPDLLNNQLLIINAKTFENNEENSFATSNTNVETTEMNILTKIDYYDSNNRLLVLDDIYTATGFTVTPAYCVFNLKYAIRNSHNFSGEKILIRYNSSFLVRKTNYWR